MCDKAYAIKIPDADCGDPDSYIPSSDDLLSGGCKKYKGENYCGIFYEDNLHTAVVRRCEIIKSDAAFLFLGFAACVGVAFIFYLAHKRGHSI